MNAQQKGSGFESDSMFLTIAFSIAKKNNCKIVEIDLQNRCIYLEGSEEDQVNCSIEFSDKLGDFLI